MDYVGSEGFPVKQYPDEWMLVKSIHKNEELCRPEVTWRGTIGTLAGEPCM